MLLTITARSICYGHSLATHTPAQGRRASRLRLIRLLWSLYQDERTAGPPLQEPRYSPDVFLRLERARGCFMSLNDQRTPRDPYPPRDPRGGGFGFAWLWILIIVIIIVIGFGWGGRYGGWWGSGGANRAANPPAQTTGQGTASRPANSTPGTPAPTKK